jgi:hypothetical protein
MMPARILGMLAAALVCAAALSACEDKQVTRYEPGKYSGAPVKAPWDSPHFGGNQKEWEAAMQARAQYQNDYKRGPAR